MIKHDVRNRCLYDALAHAASENNLCEYDRIKTQIIAECRSFDALTISDSKSYVSPLFIILLATRDFGTLHYYKGMCHLLQLFCQLDRIFISRLFQWLCGFRFHTCFRYTCLWLSQIYTECPFNDVIFDRVCMVNDNAFMQDLIHFKYPLHADQYRHQLQGMLCSSVQSTDTLNALLFYKCEPDLQTIEYWARTRRESVAIEALAALPHIKLVDAQYVHIDLIPFYRRHRARIYWRKLYHMIHISWRRTNAAPTAVSMSNLTETQVCEAANACDLAGNELSQLYKTAPWALWMDAKHVLNLTEMQDIWARKDSMINPYTRTTVALEPIRQHLGALKRQMGRFRFNYHFFYEEAMQNLYICGKRRKEKPGLRCYNNPDGGVACMCPYQVDLTRQHLHFLYAQSDVWAHINYPPDLEKFYDTSYPIWQPLAMSFIQRLFSANSFESMAKIFYNYGAKLSLLTMDSEPNHVRKILLDYIFVLVHFTDGVQSLRIDWVSSALHYTFGMIDEGLFITATFN